MEQDSSMNCLLWAMPFMLVKDAPKLKSLSIGVEASVPAGHRAPQLVVADNVLSEPMTLIHTDTNHYAARCDLDDEQQLRLMPSVPWLALLCDTQHTSNQSDVLFEAAPLLEQPLSSVVNDDSDDDFDSDNDEDNQQQQQDEINYDQQEFYFSIIERDLKESNTNSDDKKIDNNDDSKTIAIIVDKSYSRRKTESFDKELEYLRALIKALPHNYTVDVFILRDKTSEPKEFKANNVSSIIAFVTTEPFDGATNLADVDLLPSISPNSNQSYAWRALFSDGFSTLGKPLPSSFGTAPIHTFTGNNTADHDTLKAFSTRTGGFYLIIFIFLEKKFDFVFSKKVNISI